MNGGAFCVYEQTETEGPEVIRFKYFYAIIVDKFTLITPFLDLSWLYPLKLNIELR